jgi:hypothetical protein
MQDFFINAEGKTMRKTILTFVVLLVLLLVAPWFSYAGHGHYGNHRNTRVLIGGSFWFGPPPYCGPPAWGPRYYYGGPVYYAPPPVFIYRPPVYIQPQHVYVQRGQEGADYWYYCENPQGFYPYIKSCPGGWMKVVPETAPPNR